MKIILTLLTLLLAFANFAKDVPPALFVLEDPDSRTQKKVPLSITDFEADVKMHGDLALTEITLTFLNHTDRNLEGEFYYPLPANSAITGYALDVAGKMVDGVAVEKERATQVFEKIKARNIDPGLVEWESRDCFRTRVFPIFPKKTRTIRVQFLSEIKNGRYSLPLKFRKKIPAFRFKAVVYKPFPQGLRFKNRDDMLFKNESDQAIAEFAEENIIPDNDIVIMIPEAGKQKRIITETQDKGPVYFKIDDFPEIPQMTPIIPSQINIYWDVSGSRDDDRHDLEISVLKQFFAKFAEKDYPCKPYPFKA
jgi:Ca-activated chloride channel family protein